MPLEWPHGTKPSKLSDFESVARRLRYQALGRACKDHGIRRLLLAHHEDDQAETVLMRLLNGHMHLGLQGMRTSSQIPECLGIHGVAQSGEQEFLHLNPGQLDFVNPRKFKRAIEIERGGVLLHRPLLSFPKTRLMDTCLRSGVKWFEDETNSNLTITPRNTVRHLLASEKLPTALRKPKLLSLAQISQSKVEIADARSELLFREVRIIKFDLRTSRLLIHLPPLFRLSNSYKGKAITLEDRNIIILLLKRIIELVSPNEVISLRSISSVAGVIFPDLNDSFHSNNPSEPSAKNPISDVGATVGGVHFYRAGPNWEFSREPFVRNNSSSPTHTFTSTQYLISQTSQGFHLWDGRYWIQVRNKTPHDLVLRPFEESDLKPFLASLPKKNRASSQKLLRDAAPGKIKWTLPALATMSRAWEGEAGMSKVIALPTLNIKAESIEWYRLNWTVRYKHVDLGKDRGRAIIRQ